MKLKFIALVFVIASCGNRKQKIDTSFVDSLKAENSSQIEANRILIHQLKDSILIEVKKQIRIQHSIDSIRNNHEKYQHQIQFLTGDTLDSVYNDAIARMVAKYKQGRYNN